MSDVVVIGEANPDLIMSGGGVVPRFGQAETLVDSASMTLGGSGAITAAGLARLGLNVSLVAVVGDDPLGALTADQLDQLGVDTSHLMRSETASTGISVHLVNGEDRAIVTHAGAMDELSADRVSPELLQAARHVHSSSVFLLSRLRPGLGDLLALARAGGATTSIDTNWDPTEAWDVADILAQCDVILPNEAELRFLAPAGSATVAVKMGPGGGTFLSPEGDIRIAAPPGTTIVDSIWAGDSFDAGFIYGLMAGRPPVECLALGVACGALSLRATGGTAAQATAAEAERLAEILL